MISHKNFGGLENYSAVKYKPSSNVLASVYTKLYPYFKK